MLKKTKVLVLSLALVTFSLSSFANEKAENVVGNLKVSPKNNEIMVKFKDKTSKKQIDEFTAKYGTKVLKVISGINTYVLEVPKETKADKLIKTLKTEKIIQSVEANQEVSLSPIKVETKAQVNYNDMIGKTVKLKGTLSLSRSGAIIETKEGNLSIIDKNNKVLMSYMTFKNGDEVEISGTIKSIKGFNITNNLAILPN